MKDPHRSAVNRWLNSIAADVIAQQLNRRRRTRVDIGADAPNEPPTPAPPSRRDRLRARWRLVEPHLMVLPPPQREVVELRFRDGLTYRSIAARLAVPVGTVHSRLARGKQLLDERMELSGLTLAGRASQDDAVERAGSDA